MKRIFFPGSFNPFTQGHADILRRLLMLADEVTIGIGVNIDKPASADTAKRNEAEIIDYIRAEGLEERVKVKIYTGLTAEEARECGSDCLARGVRSGADFDYEYQLAALNRDAFGIETILIPADPALSYVSSTSIRDLRAHGRDDIAERYLPHPYQIKDYE